ncbi:MAG: hypothetical protein LBJ02_01360 [Bifidobacteriaceae bacterium]|jgi:CRISPR-associated protein Cmr5|nr:hypothetical protein [Bifidobacteriaceae bacterium]
MYPTDRARIDALIPKAKRALREVGIAKDGEVQKAWKGQVSAFGAAMTLGSPYAAIALFSNKEDKSSVERPLLLAAICKLIKRPQNGQNTDLATLLSNVSGDPARRRNLEQEIINATVAIKLAMNLYTIRDSRPPT